MGKGRNQIEGEAGCAFPGCRNPRHAYGYCGSHDAQKKRGKPLTAIRTHVDVKNGDRYCAKCLTVKPLDLFYAKGDGHSSWCRECTGRSVKERYERGRPAREAAAEAARQIKRNVTDRCCKVCGELKDMSEFALVGGQKGRNYRRRDCKACVSSKDKSRRGVMPRTVKEEENAKARLWYANNLERARATSRKNAADARERDPAKYREIYKRFYDNHRDRILRSKRPGKQRHYEENRDRIRSEQKLKYDSDPEFRLRVKDNAKRYSARKRGASLQEPYQSNTVWQTSQGLCYWCGFEMIRDTGNTDRLGFTVDHVVPLARGGADALFNVVGAHRSCNCSRGDTLIEELAADWVAERIRSIAAECKARSEHREERSQVD